MSAAGADEAARTRTRHLGSGQTCSYTLKGKMARGAGLQNRRRFLRPISHSGWLGECTHPSCCLCMQHRQLVI